jgi:CDP-glucose 4,6-dehydratase
LESLGAKVIGYSLDPPTDPSFFQVAKLSARVTDIRGDVRDQDNLSHVVKRYKPEFIFHLAAQPLVRSSYENPHDTFNVNVMGTVNILEAIRLSRKPAVCVCVTSDKCYENKEWEYAYRENDPLGGYDPYSASKGAAEMVIASYRRSFFSSDRTVAISSVRAGNIIGGGDWAEDRIVPDCVRALGKGATIRIRNPNAVRPWQFILDPLLGYLWLAAKMKENPELFADAWNFGPGYSNIMNVQKLVDLVIREWGGGQYEFAGNNEKNVYHEANYLMLDIAKSFTKLGWKPVYNIDNAVQKTIRWYKHYYENRPDLYAFSLDQINTFMKDAGKVIL